MKRLRSTAAELPREARVAIAVAILVAAGAISLDLGWHTGGVILLIGAGVIASAFYSLVVRPARIPRDSVLMLKITDSMREDAPRSPLAQFRSLGQPTLYHLRQALEAAAGDPALRAVVVEVSAPGIGLATAQEFHSILRAIVKAGKRVVAVMSGDSVTVRDYLIAAGAGEIVVNPDTSLMMLGVAAGGLFVRDALTKFGVEAQTLQWKEYKGAAEMFSRDAMSPELRESLDAIIADWRAILAEGIAAARGLSLERARELIASGFLGARGACDAGLIDRTGYLDDLRVELAPDEKSERRLIGLGRYLRHLAYSSSRGQRPRLALIHGLGPVITGDGPGAGEFLSGERTAADIRRAAADDSIRAIVFRVNSPGGSAVGSDLVWRAVREAQRRGKPVVVSMGDVAGSGGYYVAAGADAIVAEPATITGSIGVVYTKFSLHDLLHQVGIGIDVAKSDTISDALSLARPLTAAELDQLNVVVGELYSNFTSKVAEGRKLDPAAAEAVARGRVWSGTAAHARGLVDELGGLSRAVAIARERAGLKPEESHDLMLYPPPNLLAAANWTLARSAIPWPLSLAAAALEIPERWIPALAHLIMRRNAILLCPFVG